MAKLFDFTGMVLGRLTVLRRASPHEAATGRKWRTYWLCRCECGREKVIVSDSLKSGTKSCGCLAAAATGARSLKHGHHTNRKKTREISSWAHAKGRCFCTTDAKYPEYGGRGITMCKEWRESFQEFIAYMGPCPAGMSLDRIDNNGNYEPGNCRWATRREQVNNRRANVIVTVGGEEMTISQAASKYNVPYKALHARIRYRGQSADVAISAMKKHPL